MIRFNVMTLFPEVIDDVLSTSIIGRARTRGIIQVNCYQIRDYTLDKHKKVDDEPYGGGRGMVMTPDPIARCFEHICQETAKKQFFVYMSPVGHTLTQNMAKNLSKYTDITILCGNYEGVDERVVELYADERISIGDYVLTGGELPALVLINTVSRMVPGVLSCEECFQAESYYTNLLEHPQYTRPETWRKMTVPEVLRSGNHSEIQKWKKAQSLLQTRKYRPDLLNE